MLRLEIRLSYRRVLLSDGTLIRRGDRVGVLHLNNERVALLHDGGRTPIAVGLEFRRALLASLRTLAGRARRRGMSQVRAFAAVTIFHGLARLGFEVEPAGLMWPRLTGAYQRALLASLHPSGSLRTLRFTDGRAERLWISRERLIALYAAAARRAG